jgi:hypothetical protein
MNLKILLQSLQKSGITVFLHTQNTFTIENVKMTLKDNTVISDDFRFRFIGAERFIKSLQWEGLLISIDRVEVLRYYNKLLHEFSVHDDLAN